MKGKQIVSGVLSVATIAGGAAGVITAANNTVKTIENPVEQTIVYDTKEIIEGGTLYKYVDKDGNVYELTLDQYETLLNKINSENFHESEEDQGLVLYAGAVGTVPTTMTGLKTINLAENERSFEVTILSGYGSGRACINQYPTFAVPEAFTITSITIFNEDVDFPLNETAYSMIATNGYNIYYLNMPTYDINVGGVNYRITFE